MWDWLTGGEGETETSDDVNHGFNIDGHKGRMVRMMKRSVQKNTKKKCRKISPEKVRSDLVRIS